jgi:hypothetical protein
MTWIRDYPVRQLYGCENRKAAIRMRRHRGQRPTNIRRSSVGRRTAASAISFHSLRGKPSSN